MTTYSLIRYESEKIGIQKVKTEVVISLNEDNVPVEQIAKYTKLHVEDVIRIINPDYALRKKELFLGLNPNA